MSTTEYKFVKRVEARDLKVGDNVRMPEDARFHVLTEVTTAYTQHHMEREVGQTVRVSVGWGSGYLFPDEQVDVMTPNPMEDA